MRSCGHAASLQSAGRVGFRGFRGRTHDDASLGGRGGEACAGGAATVTGVKDIGWLALMRVESGDEEAYTLNVTLSTTTRGDVSVTVVLTIYGHDKLGDEYQISKLEPYHFLPACSIEQVRFHSLGSDASSSSSTAFTALPLPPSLSAPP